MSGYAQSAPFPSATRSRQKIRGSQAEVEGATSNLKVRPSNPLLSVPE